MVKQAAIKTADHAGDGTTTSTLLARELVKGGLTNVTVTGMGTYSPVAAASFG